MLWDIDLIFGMWVYNDKLQIKFTFRSGPMIFGRVMALELWNLPKYLVVTTLFQYDLRYWLYFWYESVWSYVTDQLWNSFRLNDFWPTYRCWALKFGQIFSCHICKCCRFLIISRFVQAILFPWIYLMNLRRFENTDLKQ
jgi:hypothetical protein